MGGDTKVWANGERVLSCMGEQCPATLLTLNVCKGGGRSRFRRRACDGHRRATRRSRRRSQSPLLSAWDIRERRYSGSEGSVLALLAAITHCTLGISQAAVGCRQPHPYIDSTHSPPANHTHYSHLHRFHPLSTCTIVIH